MIYNITAGILLAVFILRWGPAIVDGVIRLVGYFCVMLILIAGLMALGAIWLIPLALLHGGADALWEAGFFGGLSRQTFEVIEAVMAWVFLIPYAFVTWRWLKRRGWVDWAERHYDAFAGRSDVGG